MPNKKSPLRLVRDWQEHCFQVLEQDNEFAVFAGMVDLASELGYQKVAYALEFPNSVARPDFCYFSNFHPDWRTLYAENHTQVRGAKFAVGKRRAPNPEGHDPAYWCRDDFVNEALAYGVRFDWLESLPGVAGTISFVGLGGSRRPDAPYQTRNLIEIATLAMSAHLVPKTLPQATVEISEIERRCLQWVLDGKTAEVISGLLSLKVTAVRNMQRNLCVKFDKSSIFATAVLALRMGLLTPGDVCNNLSIKSPSVAGASINQIPKPGRRLS